MGGRKGTGRELEEDRISDKRRRRAEKWGKEKLVERRRFRKKQNIELGRGVRKEKGNGKVKCEHHRVVFGCLIYLLMSFWLVL